MRNAINRIVMVLVALGAFACSKGKSEGDEALPEDGVAEVSAQSRSQAPVVGQPTVANPAATETAVPGFRMVNIMDDVSEVGTYSELISFCGDKAKPETLKPVGSVVHTKTGDSYGVCIGSLTSEGIYAAIPIPTARLDASDKENYKLKRFDVVLFSYTIEAKNSTGSRPRLQIGMITHRVFTAVNNDGELWHTQCATYPWASNNFIGVATYNMATGGAARLAEDGLCPISHDAFFVDPTAVGPLEINVTKPNDGGQSTLRLKALLR